jgi:hypothetical protein
LEHPPKSKNAAIKTQVGNAEKMVFAFMAEMARKPDCGGAWRRNRNGSRLCGVLKKMSLK